MNNKIEDNSFILNIEQDVLNDIINRVKNSRISNDFGNENWQYGTEASYLKNLTSYWVNDYSWKTQEKKLINFLITK